MHNDSAAATVFTLLQNFSPELNQRFTANLWSVWKHRNVKLWRNENETCVQSVERARHLIEGWQAAKLPSTTEIQQQQQQPDRGTLDNQPLHPAVLRPNSAATAAWQAEIVPSSPAEHQQMLGSHTRNFQSLSPTYVRSSSLGLAAPLAPILPTNSETQQLMSGTSDPNRCINPIKVDTNAI